MTERQISKTLRYEEPQLSATVAEEFVLFYRASFIKQGITFGSQNEAIMSTDIQHNNCTLLSRRFKNIMKGTIEKICTQYIGFSLLDLEPAEIDKLLENDQKKKKMLSLIKEKVE